MNTGACALPAGAIGSSGTKHGTAVREEGDQAFFANGEYFPFAIDTTQYSYYAVTDRDKLGVRYRGKANHHADWGGVRANHPLPKRRPMFYFEVTVVSAGEHASVTIGLVKSTFPMTKQPGIEPGSFGYEGSQGCVFNGSSRGRTIGSSFSEGDTVGLGVNFKKMEAFLTHNGKFLGTAFPGIRCGPVAAGLYPCVGLHGPGEAVRLNFGQQPFLFDPSAILAQEGSREQAAVDAVPVCPSLMRALVRDYLLHQGCEKTLRSLGEADGQPEDAWGRGADAASSAAKPPSPLRSPVATNGATPLLAGADGKESPKGTSSGGDGVCVSAAMAWGGGPATGGQATGAASDMGGSSGTNRSSEDDMDVEGEGGAAAGVGESAGRSIISAGRGNEEDEEEEKRAEVDVGEERGGGRLSRASGTAGRGEAYESAAAGGDLLRQLQLHLGVGEGSGLFGRGSLFLRQDGGGDEGGTSGGGGDDVEGGSGRRQALENEEDELDNGDDDQESDGEGPEQEGEEEESVEGSGEEEEGGELDDGPYPGDNFGRINDGDRDDEDYGDGREGAEDEHEGEEDEEEEDAEDVFIPWIPCRPFRDAVHREVVRPVHVKRLLSEGGPRATLLTHTLSLRTRLRRNILEGKIDRATQLLQLERPGLLEKRADVRFALKCQAFIELVKKGQLTAAVALAQRDLSPFRDTARVRFNSPWVGGLGEGGDGGEANGMRRFQGGGFDPATSPSSKNSLLGSSPPNSHHQGGVPTAGSPSQSSITARAVRHARGGGSGSQGTDELTSTATDRACRKAPGGAVAGEGGRASRAKGTRPTDDECESDGDGTQRRTRKRRTRSYDDRRVCPGDSQASGAEWGARADVGSGAGPTDSVRRGFPSTFCGIPSTYDSKLIAVMGLLAYKNPANSPLGHLVSGLQNQAIADKVNDAVLADTATRRGFGLSSALTETHVPPPASGLELLKRHLLATRQASREAAGDGRQADMRYHL